MKKLLLSSIIILGVCSFVTAQNATGVNPKKAEAKTNSAATTPQKAVVASQFATDDIGSAKAPSDKANPAATSVKSAKEVAKPAGNSAVAVGADGVALVNEDAAKKREIEKAEAVKAAAPASKKNNDN
jgi:hypothetical protein